MFCVFVIYCDKRVIGIVLRIIHECGGHGHQSVIFPRLRSYERVKDEPRDLELVDSTIVSPIEAADRTLESSVCLSPLTSLKLSREDLSSENSETESKLPSKESILEQLQEVSAEVASV